MNRIPYAAQTYSGVADRVISIPWLRMENDGRSFTGTCGIPVELGCKRTQEGYALIQRPVRELLERREKAGDGAVLHRDGKIVCRPDEGKALMFEMRAADVRSGEHVWEINGSRVCYDPGSGRLAVDGEECQAGRGHKEMMLLVDDRILEIFFDGGVCLGTFILRERLVSLELADASVEEYAVYEV